jgi:hypothetical protein
MQSDSSEILILDLQYPTLQAAPAQDGFYAQKIQFSVLTKFLENQNTKSQLLPDNLKTFYTDCRKEFVTIRQTPEKLENGNEKAIKFLEDIRTAASLHSFNAR